MKWISVEDKLPETEGEYLGLRQANKQIVQCAFYRNSKDRYGFIVNGKANIMTHWMPLPESPTN